MNFSDRIKGAIFGVVLGDALGLGTEFMTVDEVKYHYPDGLRHFSQIIRDAHRGMWKRGEWTNDATINHMLMKSIMEHGRLNLNDFALKIRELFYEDSMDMPDFYSALINDPDWLDRPLEVAHQTWHGQKLWRARNEALPRAIITGILGMPRIVGNTLDVISITHDDTRCTCCGVLIATMADSLLRTGEPTEYQALRDIVHTHDGRMLHALDRAYNGQIQDLELDDPENFWQTRKCMAAGLWPIWHCNSAQETLDAIVDAGGDADTNAAVAMGLAGLKYGFDGLPDEVHNLPQFKEIEQLADQFISFMEKYEKEK